MKSIHCLMYRKISLLICFSFFNFCLFAEGTKQLMPASTDNGYICLYSSWSDFALAGCAPTSRLQITVCNPNEIIYFGFKTTSSGLKYRIRNSTGTGVIPSTNLVNNITSYAQAVAGPKQLPGLA